VATLGEAVVLQSQGQYDSALSRAQTALRIFQEKERSDYEGKTYNLIGLIHYDQGRYAEALEAYQKALTIRERIGDQQGIASCIQQHRQHPQGPRAVCRSLRILPKSPRHP
jgi:tetratricopeptide (TPR) repeat protein